MKRLTFLAVVLALATPKPSAGQDALDPTRLEIGRAELTRLLAQYDAVAQSTAYSAELRTQGAARADLIRERLERGDFRPGDEIAVFIEGGQTAAWDTLTVEEGYLVDVPTLGPIALQGVLRSELEAHLTTEVARFIQTPRVRASALIRIAALGVVRPGFYTLPASLPLSDAVMAAGGPGAQGDPGQIRIERGRGVLWSVEELLGPVAEGWTLDQLGLRAGDRIVLPATSQGPSPVLQQVLTTALYIAVPLFLGVSIR